MREGRPSEPRQSMPDASRLMRLLAEVRQANLAVPGRQGAMLALGDAHAVVVTGDLHGNRGNFQVIARRAALARHPDRHLVVQEVLHGGPRDDSGAGQSHLLLDDILRLAQAHPGRVHILMGNHEMSEWTGRRLQKAGEDVGMAYRMGLARSYGDQAARVGEAIRALCGSLPLVVVLPNRIAAAHSMPHADRLADVSADTLREDLTPDRCGKGCLAFELVWGRLPSPSDAQAFARWLDVDWVVTGHEPCPDGYALPHPHHVMLETSGWPGAYLLLPTDHPLTPEEIRAAIKPI